MKIYPSKHKIVQTQKIDLYSDIPLAYIDASSKDYVANVENTIAANGIKPVLPYQVFDSYEMTLFSPKNKDKFSDSNDFVEIDHSSIIKRIANEYQYIPEKTIVFSPQEFDYSVIVKKHLDYDTKTTFNIKAACLDDMSKTTGLLSKQLLKVLGDAPRRGICPANVWVNNKDVAGNSLINSIVEKNDFIFIQSPDGVNYNRGDKIIPINFNEDYLSKHVNVWLSVDTFPEKLTNQKATITAPVLYKNLFISNSTFVNVNVPEFVIETEQTEEVITHRFFYGSYSAAIVKEYKNKGFVIYTPKEFFENIEENVKVFYDLLMKIYSITYVESKAQRQWITDVPPNYVVINNRLNSIEKFLSASPIHRIIGLSSDQIAFSDIKISAENITMTGIDNDYLVFKKIYAGPQHDKYNDPPKPNGMISIYTQQNQIMYFESFVYTIEDDISKCLTYSRKDNDLVFSAKSFKHSYAQANIPNSPVHNFCIPLVQTINYEVVPLLNETFYLTIKNNILSYHPVSSYAPSDGFILAEINIKKTDDELSIYDMRIKGGGLPTTCKDNDELLDIGYIEGLAYRKAGALIITLPGRLKQFNDIIETSIKKHMVAEKYPVILYENDGEDDL